jgi:hypothetical protein
VLNPSAATGTIQFQPLDASRSPERLFYFREIPLSRTIAWGQHMDFEKAVSLIGTVTDLRRIASAHVIDHNQLKRETCL